MFTAILKTQWKWTRAMTLMGFVLGFTIPVLSLTVLGEAQFGNEAASLIRFMQQFGVLYAFLAGGVGLATAMLAWSHDHRGRHVYALSLPISRTRYAAMRFGAGSLFLLGPALGVLTGCIVGIANAAIPDGLHAYPMALTIRFLLASFVAYAVFFAISSSSTKASGYILWAITAIMLVLFVMAVAGVGQGVLRTIGKLLFAEYGLLSVFTGRWMLVDV